jgi:hypothetical protein
MVRKLFAAIELGGYTDRQLIQSELVGHSKSLGAHIHQENFFLSKDSSGYGSQQRSWAGSGSLGVIARSI